LIADSSTFSTAAATSSSSLLSSLDELDELDELSSFFSSPPFFASTISSSSLLSSLELLSSSSAFFSSRSACTTSRTSAGKISFSTSFSEALSSEESESESDELSSEAEPLVVASSAFLPFFADLGTKQEGGQKVDRFFAGSIAQAHSHRAGEYKRRLDSLFTQFQLCSDETDQFQPIQRLTFFVRLFSIQG